MTNYAPIDGLAGFSQGAILAAALPGMQAKGIALTRVPKIEFLMIISGAKFKNESWAEKAYSLRIQCPSFHFLGHDASHDTHCSRICQESNEVAKNKISKGDSSSLSDATKLNVTTELASKKHALSERKRRKRINGHYDSLRKFFPRLLKNDKASVLTETVRHLKELKSMVANVALLHDDGERCSDKRLRQSFFMPSEKDEVSVNFHNSGDKIAIQATICCEDRPELNQELTEAIRSVQGKVVKAEMATVGGRTKVEATVEWPECSGRGEEYVGMLKRTLKAVMENRVMVKTKLTDHIFT